MECEIVIGIFCGIAEMWIPVVASSDKQHAVARAADYIAMIFQAKLDGVSSTQCLRQHNVEKSVGADGAFFRRKFAVRIGEKGFAGSAGGIHGQQAGKFESQ